MSKVVLVNLKRSEPIDVLLILDGMLMSQCSIRTTEKENTTP